MAIIDQINARVDPAVKARFDAAAAALEVPASQLFRELLTNALPDIEARADDAVQKRNHWPGAIPQHAVETALAAFLRAIARSEPLKLLPLNLYGAEGKALWTLLSWLWSEGDAGDEAKARKKLASWLESLNIKATVGAITAGASQSSGAAPHIPDSKPVKNYPRRGAADEG